MKKRLANLKALLFGLPLPQVLARRPGSHSARTGRNPMADRPHNFCGGLRPAVRSVQHLKPLFDGRNLSGPRSSVTGKPRNHFPCSATANRF